MSIIPTIDKKAASREAKEYLKQYHDWELIAKRWLIFQHINGTDAPAAVHRDKYEEHQKAIAECQRRLSIIETVKKANPTGGWILFYRFVKGYRVRRTIDELAAHQDTNIHEREVYRQQRAALLAAYDIIPVP